MRRALLKSSWRSSETAPPASCGLPSSANSHDSRTSRRDRDIAGLQEVNPSISMIRPTVARVDLDALKSNYHRITEYLASDGAKPPGAIAVVKANAYGHGAPQVARALEDAGADLLACADIEEGAALRSAGVRAGILVFGALSVSDLDGLFDCRLTPTISTPSAARAVQAAAARHRQRVGYHLKIDTGMNRLGFRHDNLRRTIPELLASEQLELEAVYTHFATADDPESPLFGEQRLRFAAALKEIGRIRDAQSVALHTTGQPYVHAANSAALLRDSRVWYDRVRPGLLLYGLVPPPLASTLPLTPAMTLGSRVVAVKGVRTGEPVGYGAKFTAERPTTIAIVPAGYADGLDLRLAGRGAVLIRGRRAPVVGSVSMDMLMADVTGLDVSPGDEVVVIGSQGADRIDVRELAAEIGTIPYEDLCRIGSRIERVYTS